MRKFLAVARHEFKKAAANKTFVIITILGPFLILAVTVLPTLFNNDPASVSGGKPVAVTVASDALWDHLEEGLNAAGLEAARVGDLAAGKDGVLSGAYAGLLELGPSWPDEPGRFYSRTGTDMVVYGAADSILGAYAMELRMGQLGLQPDQVQLLMSKPGMSMIKLGQDKSEEEKQEQDFLAILMTSLSFVMLLYMTVLLYGQMIGRSVVLEKTNKTVEIMLSSVSSRELMFGKIAGLGLAALLQYGVWMAMAGLMIRLVGPALGVALPASLTLANFGWLVVFFVLGFFLYSSAYAALGAAAEDEQHLGQLAWPLILFLVIPMVAISSIVMNPGSTLPVVLSFFPLTSPMVMLVRILVSTPAAWEIALSIGLLIAAIAGMVVFAAKIFRVGILLTGKRHTLVEVLKWSLKDTSKI